MIWFIYIYVFSLILPFSLCSIVLHIVVCSELIPIVHIMAGRRQATFNVFTPLAGRGRSLLRMDVSSGAVPKLQIPTSAIGPGVSPSYMPPKPSCSAPVSGDDNVVHQLRELIGETKGERSQFPLTFPMLVY